MKRIVLFILISLSLAVQAQRQRNYVYLFDCTKSMIDPSHIWEEAKSFLKEDVSQLDENANVTIVLFHQNTSTPIRFKAKEFKWKDVESLCEKMIQESNYTGICNAWDLGLKYIDEERNNYMYLFTDGTENVNKRRTDAVCDRIQNWCRLAPNNYAFFVVLGEQMKKSPDVQKLINATKTCERTFFIDKNNRPGPFGAFDKTFFTQNSHSPKNIIAGFSDYGTFNAKVECKDDYYDISLLNDKIKDGKAEFVIKQKKLPTSNYQIHFTVRSKESELHICNPDLFINIDTRELANLDMGQPTGLTEGQYNAGEAETYSSFLFWKGKNVASLNVDLSAAFNEQARKKNGTLNVLLNLPSEMMNKCKLYYNGRPTNNSFAIKSSETQSIVTIEVPHDLVQKAFTVEFKGTSNNLETINAEERNTYVSSIYFEHVICWNPAKVIFMWISICLLAALIAWFALLKPFFYPRIRLSRLELSTKKGYYVNKKINGSRMVVVTNHYKPQNWLSKLFTGKITYIKDELWTSSWELTPKGRRKVAKINLHGKYMISPVTSEIANYGTYQLDNLTTKESITIKIL
jgi:hypothetical protein